jgi:hypothetical protein
MILGCEYVLWLRDFEKHTPYSGRLQVPRVHSSLGRVDSVPGAFNGMPNHRSVEKASNRVEQTLAAVKTSQPPVKIAEKPSILGKIVKTVPRMLFTMGKPSNWSFG